MAIIRTRWAAIGAAVAVTLGAGGIGLVSATNPDDALTFVAITPCRVLDTRTEFNVGPKTSPMGPGETYTVKTHGSNGNCTGIPAGATAVSMNMTATDATAPTFLAVWAAGTDRPDASSLNPVPGSPPTPNAVTTELNGSGEFNIYNLQGSVNVFADINGYYVGHNHDDRYYTKAQSDARYLEAPPTEIPVELFSFNSFPDPDVWISGYGIEHDSGGTYSCLRAPVELRAGSTVTGVRVTYLAESPATVSVYVRRLPNGATTTAVLADNSFVLASQMILPVTPAETFRAATFVHQPAILGSIAAVPVGGPESQHYVQFCTDDVVGLLGATVLLTN